MNSDHEDGLGETETIEELRTSFWYGSRSNLNFKFLKDLSDDEFGSFVEEMLDAVAGATDTGEVAGVVDVAYRWQRHAYTAHLGEPADFPHRYADVPFARLDKPLAEARVGLLTSSGHFVAGDDPKPFGVDDMSQQEAEDRVGEFLRAAPELSAIPVDTDARDLRVRHGGYPVEAVATDHQVALPLGHLRALERQGVIGELAPTAYSFVGAASQLRLRKTVAPAWAEKLRSEDIDAVVFVPV